MRGSVLAGVRVSDAALLAARQAGPSSAARVLCRGVIRVELVRAASSAGALHE